MLKLWWWITFHQDDSVPLIRNWVDGQVDGNLVKLIAFSENSRFSGENNTGISAVEADFYLLLNSDTLVRKGAVSTLLESAISNTEAGLIGPRLEWPDATPQESCFRFHTSFSQLISSANTGFITNIFKKYNVPYPVSDQLDFYDWTSFACVLVRAEVFKEIGLMDDGYFMYFEDVAFAHKAQKAFECA